MSDQRYSEDSFVWREYADTDDGARVRCISCQSKADPAAAFEVRMCDDANACVHGARASFRVLSDSDAHGLSSMFEAGGSVDLDSNGLIFTRAMFCRGVTRSSVLALPNGVVVELPVNTNIFIYNSRACPDGSSADSFIESINKRWAAADSSKTPRIRNMLMRYTSQLETMKYRVDAVVHAGNNRSDCRRNTQQTK